MDLNKAFGSAFVSSSKLGTSDQEVTKPEVELDAEPEVVTKVVRKTKPIPPEVYVLHVQIGREDCHLLCMFLLIFAVSFILSSR